MTQLIAVLSFMLISSGVLRAQDLPPLPPAAAVDSQASVSASASLPSGPGTMPALPPMPSTGTSSPAATAPASDGGTMPALPPMPASASAGTSDSSASGTMPPLPSAGTSPASDNGQASSWTSPSLQTPASGPASAVVVPDVPKASLGKTKHKITPAEQYKMEHTRPNVIYSGWVWPKGQDVDDKLAWTSQEILNALVPHGFTVTKEEGNYDGEDTRTFQWRQWTFSIDHSQVTTQVYIKPLKQRVWVRVGPSEAPAGLSLREVQAIQKQDLRMLKLLRQKLGKRLTPHHRGSWAAPYNYKRETADE
jgi:hypothetical protein